MSRDPSSPGQPPGGPPSPWDLEEPPRGTRPRRALLVLAVVPWAIALVLGIALLGSEAEAPTRAEPPAPEAPPSPPVAEEEGVLAEAGTLVVRAALSGSQEPTRYVDAAVPTGVQVVGAASVVSVLALVLEGGDRGWERATLERYAVALQPGEAGPTVRAGPWALPPLGETPSSETVRVDDPALPGRVAAALESAGYRDVTVLELSRDGALPGVLLARVTATPPGRGAPGESTALLEDTPSPTLLGEKSR